VNIHEKYIRRCIEIAKNGLGLTAPNPMVGCVIVHKNKIIGEGFTSPYGFNHAEVNAILSVTDKSLLKKSKLYVTLEPCSHQGKTPPCASLIISYNIPEVIIGCLDENPKVSGKGIAQLKEGGTKVSVGILENECKKHHKRFFTFHNKKRPYIILKWAETEDGFIAPLQKSAKSPVWITNLLSRQLVHKWRSEEQAILVGFNTVLEDNPKLTVRDWTGRNPIRIVLDRDNKLSKEFEVFNNQAKTLVIKSNTADDICDEIFNQGINSVIIEGGAQTLQLFINEGLWDEARVFIGQKTFGSGIKAPLISGSLKSESRILEDTLKIFTND